MDNGPGAEHIQTIMPYGTWRKRLFQLRFSLDKSPRLLLTLQIFLGAIINLHPGLSFAILTLSNNYDRFELSLIPLICLCIEVLIFTSSTLVYLITEKTSKNQHLTTWHRDSAFSLLKDIYISIMVLISLVLCIIYIDTHEKGLIFRSIFAMTLPLLILCASSLLTCLLLKTRRTLLWCTLNVLGLCTIILLILKIDYGWNVAWATVIAPAGVMFIALMICSVFGVANRIKEKDFIGVFFCCFSIAGCGSALAFVFFAERSLMFNVQAIFSFKVSGWITIVLLIIGYSRKSGAWLLGVVFGHIEVDFRHFKRPTLTESLLTSRAKSV